MLCSVWRLGGQYARSTKLSLGLRSVEACTRGVGGKFVLFFLWRDHSHLNMELIRTCVWQIWGARNEVCFDKISIHPSSCYARACDLLSEYGKANARVSCSMARAKAKWLPLLRLILTRLLIWRSSIVRYFKLGFSMTISSIL